MTDEEYYDLGSFDDIYISSSCLKSIDPETGGSPMKFKDFFDKEKEKKVTKAMSLGTKIHKFCESPEEFITSEVVEPGEKSLQWVIGVFNKIPKDSVLYSFIRTGVVPQQEGTDLVKDDLEDTILKLAAVVKTELNLHTNIKKEETLRQKFKDECRDYLDFLAKADGKVALNASEAKVMEECQKSLYSNGIVNPWIFGDWQAKNAEGEIVVEKQTEIGVIWEDTQIGGKVFRMKAKLDSVIIDHLSKTIFITDVKTTSDPLSLFKWSFRNYRVYRQLAFYGEAARIQYAELIKDGYKIMFNIIAIETKDLYECGLFQIEFTDDWIKKGQTEIGRLLTRILFHQESGDWVNPWEVQLEGCYKLPTPEELRS